MGLRRTWIALIVIDPVGAIVQAVEIPAGGEHHVETVARKFGHFVCMRSPHVHYHVRLHVTSPTLHAHIDTSHAYSVPKYELPHTE